MLYRVVCWTTLRSSLPPAEARPQQWPSQCRLNFCILVCVYRENPMLHRMVGWTTLRSSWPPVQARPQQWPSQCRLNFVLYFNGLAKQTECCIVWPAGRCCSRADRQHKLDCSSGRASGDTIVYCILFWFTRQTECCIEWSASRCCARAGRQHKLDRSSDRVNGD